MTLSGALDLLLWFNQYPKVWGIVCRAVLGGFGAKGWEGEIKGSDTPWWVVALRIVGWPCFFL